MNRNPITVDVAILGAGSAGLTARRAAKAAGASVLMIDPGPFGTTCARVGCMPSKLLIAAADAAHHARQAAQFGVLVSAVQIDGRAVLARLHAERDRFVGSVLQVTEEAKGDGEVLVGRARIVAPGRLTVDQLTEHEHSEVLFKQLVVATGSVPIVPAPFRGLGDAMLTTDSVFDLVDLPRSLLVVGLGVVGLELGQAFHRLGVRTTLLGVGGGIGPLTDPEVLSSARRVLCAELDLHPEYEFRAIEPLSPPETGVRIQFVDSHGTERSEVFERVLMAAGRRAQLSELGLEQLGIAAEHGMYPIDPETLQLADAPVFVAGDANNFHPLLHEAADDGRGAGINAARYPDVRALPRSTPIAVVFSDPQIGMVGQSYRALADCGAVAGEVDFADQGRARVQAVNQGKARIYAERATGRLLGAELFGPAVEHLSHLLAWSIQQGMSVDQTLSMPFYHPVVEEGLRTALRQLNANLRKGAPIKCRVSELGVGS